MTIWEPKNEEFLETRLEPENKLDKYAVEVIKNSIMVGHSFSFFLCASNDNSCKVEVTESGVNLGDGYNLQIPCNLHFTRHVNFINKLKKIDAMKMKIRLYFLIRFCLKAHKSSN